MTDRRLRQPSAAPRYPAKGGPLFKSHRMLPRPPFECIALLLQGGGALGAYQGGVYQALAEADLQPDWVAGISIGAINAAIIAGNPPEHRVERLRTFWETVTATPFQPIFEGLDLALRGDYGRSFLNHLAANLALTQGAADFFAPRFPPPFLSPPGTVEATSWYDTSALRTTLESLVDFDRINSGAMRLSVGAVNIGTGNFVYFDTTTDQIGVDHIMASGALPPGFPAVEIDGQFYWDGGLVSNTPLQWVVDSEPRLDTLAFQVDLWSARGEFPIDLQDVVIRQKEIQYSSRTRSNTDVFKRLQKLRYALSNLLEKLPPELLETAEVQLLKEVADRKVYNIVQLIYRSKHYEGHSKDYEFSRKSMEDHWRAGYQDAVRTLRHRQIMELPPHGEGVRTFDIRQEGRN